MAFDFSSITLEVIDLNVNATPDIFVNQNGITFSKRVLEDMNYPQYVQYCTDPAHHVFAVRACKGTETKAAPFSKPRGEQSNTMSSSNRNLREVVAHLIPNYDKTTRYKVSGNYDASNKTMYFDMTEAVVSEFRAKQTTSDEE
jgi:hypothetical protein